MSAEGSGVGPEGQSTVDDDRVPVGPRLIGFAESDDPFTGDRWTGDEWSDDRAEPRNGERTPEQEATDLLMRAEAAQGLEPEYDFDYQSAEGGNGSPEQESLHTLTGLQETGHGGKGVLGVTPERPQTAELFNPEASRSLVREPNRAQQGPLAASAGTSEVLNGIPEGRAARGDMWEQIATSTRSVDDQASLAHAHVAQAQARTSSTQAVVPVQSRAPSDSDRVDMLETLVYQLMEQNEALKRDMLETQSGRSESSGRGMVGPVQSSGRGMVGPVQSSGRCVVGPVQSSGRGTIGPVHSSSQHNVGGNHGMHEGRGVRRPGEQRVKSGKGLGSAGGNYWAPTFRTFQPPWTSFSGGDAVLSTALPAEGPGDRLLATTRALQSLTLQETPDVQMTGLAQASFQECSVRSSPTVCEAYSGACPDPDSVSAAGLPVFSTRGLEGGKVGMHNDSSQEVSPPVPLIPSASNEQGQVHAQPSLGSEARTITVMINGVPRSGMFNDKGEIVVALESPKYFEIGEGDRTEVDPVQCTPVELGEARTIASESISGNPFSVQAASPFQPTGCRSALPTSCSPPPPPPPVPGRDGSRFVRGGSKSPGGYRSGYPRRPSRSPDPSPPRTMPMQLKSVNASPLTPGGTKVPSGPPPGTPLDPGRTGTQTSEVGQGAVSASSGVGLNEGSSRDFVPGERTYWELPTLAGPSSEANPAMRCNDWIYRITPLMSDLAPRANAWWGMVLKEAQAAYQEWSVAKPLERARIVGKPSKELQGNAFTRIESRGVAMLSKALPAVVYEQALSSRNVSCVGLLFLTLRIYQPGGLNERAELLRGLTTLPVFDSPSAAVSGLQKWFRHLERARTMEISVPDSSLLLDSIDRALASILHGHPTLTFRMHSVRMQLQLDTRPLQDTVEEYARTLLAEMELLAVAAPESGNAKRQRVAAVAMDGQKGKGAGSSGSSGKGGEGGQANSADPKGNSGQRRTPCTGWITDKGCKFGKSCVFSHSAERQGKCWACGGSHQKAECTAPGGGKHQKPSGDDNRGSKGRDGKAKGSGKDQGSGPKGKPGGSTKGGSQAAGGISSEAIKEAAQILQSMKLASLSPHVESMSALLKKAQMGIPKGLIDGGATACLRMATGEEQCLPEVSVKLACGECKLLVNREGTLLSRSYVSPILSVRAALALGYRIDWDSSRCRVWHPSKGDLTVDDSSGCPEIPESTALSLISQYEELVRSREVRSARMQCLMQDLTSASNEDLARSIIRRDTHADAAVQMLLRRIFPETSAELVAQATVTVQDGVEENFTWNRRMRRRFEKSEGLVLHLFCGKGRKAFDAVAERSNLVHVPVDRGEDLLSDDTFQFLMRQAARGRVKAIVAAPPSKTFAECRYARGRSESVIRPIRIRGESIGSYGIEGMTGQELAQRRIDDVLLMRMMTLMIVAGAANRGMGCAPLACVVEHPEDSEHRAATGAGIKGAERPEQGYASLWATPEWCAVSGELGLSAVSFHQGPLGHVKVRPTTLYTNLHPDPVLVDCWGEGYSGNSGVDSHASWSEWAPGLWLAVANMLGRVFRDSIGLSGTTVRAIDSGFIHHLQQNHTPYRRDCRQCVAGSGRRRPPESLLLRLGRCR